jgi:putative transposase
LVRDQDRGEIARGMQGIAGRTGEEYNRRKGRKGAYWEDRDHAAVVDTEDYLAHGLVYIDLNRVRAGVVSHPAQWAARGCRQLKEPLKRYGILDVPVLMERPGFRHLSALQRARRQWVQEALRAERRQREAHGRKYSPLATSGCVEGVKAQLEISARYRAVEACLESAGGRSQGPF